MTSNRLHEILEEIKIVFSGRTNTIDAIIPPLLFLILNGFFGFTVAMWSSLAIAGFICSLRVLRKQPLIYAFGGLAGVGLAILLSVITERAESYFLPNIISSSFILLVCIFSALVKRPLAAYASHLTRSWPISWFWQQQVRPAYVEVTWIWVIFITLRLALQVFFYQMQAASTLAWVNIVTGWPVTIGVLILSYVYGIWRLQNLNGPGVEEFIQGKEPPWEGQKRGF